MMDKKIQNQLVQIGLSTEKVKKIILFGSRAVGDDTDRSDIDLAIVAPEMSKEEWVLFALDLEDELDTLLSLDIIKFEDASQQLKSEILKNGKILYQDDDTPNEMEKDNLIESP
ncbi:type VII toxin-antitoxin system MntA family adenylyltransferase antitoxin [Heyndrickxia faecalis]|uniref:type VII toxin-antitoxin system MntA family adenylyltransferase antitoxin n=1 Tax=Heyndrickxia faecalis TaxID=2824910 RepID=UPI003D1DAE6F